MSTHRTGDLQAAIGKQIAEQRAKTAVPSGNPFEAHFHGQADSMDRLVERVRKEPILLHGMSDGERRRLTNWMTYRQYQSNNVTPPSPSDPGPAQNYPEWLK